MLSPSDSSKKQETSTDSREVASSTQCAFSCISSQGFCEHCFAVHFLQFQSYSVAYLIICVVNSSENQKNVLCENVEFYHYLKSL